MRRYEAELDLGGEAESEAVVTVRGADADVLELIGRLHVLARRLREEADCRPD